MSKKETIAKVKRNRTYHLVIETIDRFDTEFKMVGICATSVKEAVIGYLEEDYYDAEELTVDGKNGRYVGEEISIGIGTTKEAAALQYIYSRMENQG